MILAFATSFRFWRMAILVIALATTHDAIGQTESARRSAPADPEAAALFREAAVLQKQHNFAAAEQQWRMFLNQFPDDRSTPEARHDLGICLMHQDKLIEAVEQFQVSSSQLKDSSPVREESLMNLGWCLYNLGMRGAPDQLTAASEVFQQLRTEYPTGDFTDQALFYEGECLFQTGHGERAIAAYEQLVRDYPDSRQRPDALYALTVAYQDSGNLPSALACCDTFFQEFPEHELTTEMTIRQGEVLFQDRQFDLAKKAFERLMQGNGFELADYVSMRIGACYEALDDAPGAAAHFSTFTEQFPNSQFIAGATLGAARNYVKASAWDKAETWYRLAGERNPQWQEESERWIAQIQAHKDGRSLPQTDAIAEEELKRGEEAYAAGNLELAKRHYASVIRDYPDASCAPQAWYGRAWVHMRQGELGAAVHDYSYLLDQYPDDSLVPRCLQGRALARQRQGEFAAGLVDCDAFLATHPPENLAADGWYVKALCEIGLSQREQAYQSLNAVRQRYPDYARADHVLYELAWLWNSDDSDEASRAFHELAERYPNSKYRGEALIHLGDAEFSAGRNDRAAAYFREAIQVAATANVAETAMYKLGYLLFREKQYANARTVLQQERQSYPDGKLLADATFLTAECWFAEKEYANAVALYQTLQSVPLQSDWSRQLLHLHAGQALIHTQQYADALAWLDPLHQQQPPSPLKWKARWESARALAHLDRWEDAKAAYTEVVSGDDTALSARAQSMLDEITQRD